jgi:5-methylcytosine-specific restriction endonuclease McrA
MQFQLENFHRDISDEELLADLRKAHELLKAQGKTLSFRTYSPAGRFSAGTIAARFGSWNKALASAGLATGQEHNVGRDALFENLRVVWTHKGKQPVFRDMAKPPSQYSASIYIDRFGNWRNALRGFVGFVQSEEYVANEVESAREPLTDTKTSTHVKRRTGRNITERMRFRILVRDGFACQTCGSSPIKDRGVDLHVDHILPWSKGGETEESNLQTKCQRCNLGKGNAFEQ